MGDSNRENAKFKGKSAGKDHGDLPSSLSHHPGIRVPVAMQKVDFATQSPPEERQLIAGAHRLLFVVPWSRVNDGSVGPDGCGQ